MVKHQSEVAMKFTDEELAEVQLTRVELQAIRDVYCTKTESFTKHAEWMGGENIDFDPPRLQIQSRPTEFN
jgi:hypothetical protein